MNKNLKKFVLGLIAVGGVSLEARKFDANFKFGASISGYQVEGAKRFPHCNWAFFEKKPGAIENNEQSGYACNHWDLYQQDFGLLQELGLNAFRFSADWSAIEPAPGKFDEAVLEYYVAYCVDLVSRGISVMVTLHHFTHPQWFEALGGFEKEQNIRYFVRFAQKVYEKLHNYVDFWCTINEPTILVLQGYFRGAFPPAKVDPLLGLQVLRNLMQAHTEVYCALKEQAEALNKEVAIGLAHAYMRFNSYSPWNVLERIPGYLFNYLLNDTILNFCRTGIFEIQPWAPQAISTLLPQGISNITPSFFTYKTPTGARTLDFFGLNYYSHMIIQHKPTLTNPFNVIPSCLDNEIMTDMPYGIYPQGLYNAIVDVSKLGLPIYITENGIADAQDTRRKGFIKQHLKVVERALDDNYDVRGYYYWSLLDNFEWDFGYSKKFGLYAVDFETQERTLREGSKYYRKFIQKHKHNNLVS